MTWIDEVRSTPATDVADRLGYEPRRHASSSSCKCPACGAERRHTKSTDRRGAVGIPHASPWAWRCFQCDAGGDAIDFASWHLGDSRFADLSSDRRAEVRSFFGHDAAARVAAPKPAPRQAAPEHNYPVEAEVASMWASCIPLDRDRGVAGYLAHRGIAPVAKLVEQDCARALPEGALCPEWAYFGERAWSNTGHRLIVPLYDSTGRMRSLIARSVERDPLRKSLGARGKQRGGLLMAGTFGRAVLQSGPQAHWHAYERLRATVYEGEIDFLRAVARGEDVVLSHGRKPASFRAVFGIFAGSFTPAVAARLPSGTLVVIATDADSQGDKYAAEIQTRVGERCEFQRVRVEQDRP